MFILIIIIIFAANNNNTVMGIKKDYNRLYNVDYYKIILRACKELGYLKDLEDNLLHKKINIFTYATLYNFLRSGGKLNDTQSFEIKIFIKKNYPKYFDWCVNKMVSFKDVFYTIKNKSYDYE